MNLLLLGASGQVGRAMAAVARPGDRVDAPDRARVDIVDPDAVGAAVSSRCFDWIVNAAAYTAVDRAEDEPAMAAAANADALRILSQAATLAGARLLHLSTDFVFDGRSSVAYEPHSPTHPLSVYGATKLAGEIHALADPRHIVLRTSWVYASIGRNFVLTILRLLAERDEIRVVRDQVGAPTWAAGIARAIWALIDRAAPGGIYHWSDDGVASWYDFAVAIQDEALTRRQLSWRKPIVPIRTADYPTRAVRPPFSVLNCDSTHAVTGLPPTHWRDHLRAMLDEL